VATLAAALDLQTPNAFPLDGIDIRPALRGNALARTQPLYWQFPFGVNLRDGSYATAPGLAIRDGVWKLHCDLKFEKIELYNMDVDANEKWNMQGVYPEIAARLLGQIKKIYAEVNGPYSRTAHFINPQMRDPEGAKTSGKREP
jgi:uncharacterized sulfatase